jgi:fatty acid-binding protein DegV
LDLFQSQDSEIIYILFFVALQVSALMEGKALLSQEVLELRQKLVDSQLTGKEKEKLVEKAATLAAENVSLKAAMDELAAQKANLDEKTVILQEAVQQR